MDLHRIIQELTKEREQISRIIESLESMNRQTTPGVRLPPKRRGRKFMDEADRQEVSVRMRTYWAKRRAARTTASTDPEAQPDQRFNRIDMPQQTERGREMTLVRAAG